MKTKSITTFLFLAFAAFADASASSRSENKGYKVEFNQARSNEMSLNFSLDKVNISEVTINGVKYSQFDSEKWNFTDKKGYAALPILNAAVQLPADKNVSLSVERGDYTDYNLNYPLVPSRGRILRNQDPSKIPYVIDPASLVDAWYPSDIAVSTDPFIMRDVRGTSVYVNPIQYNAAKKILRVYNTIRVNLIENNSEPVNPLTDLKKFVDPDMFTTYQSLFLNYNTRANWANESGEYGEILVLYTSRDAAVIKPWINWKKQMGYRVTEQQVATGTNVKATIKTAYTSNTKIVYVQLVGDWADIKSDLGGGANAPMDPMLGCVIGTDNFPDIVVGRFSAGSTADVTTQVNKTITYEKNPGGTWYKSALHIASAEGAGQGDDGEVDKAHSDNIWTGRLSKFTYATKNTSYDPGASASQVSTAVNAGVSVINYTGHGANNQFVTSGFNNSNVNSLTNGEKLPFIFSVACVNGEFHTTTCFAEAWLRKVGGGAVATLMATINQDWVPPMIGQDYMNDLLVGGYKYASNSTNPGKGTNTDHGKNHFGAIAVNGGVLMLSETTSALSTIQTWTIFGDASLQVRTDAPKALVVSNPNVPAGSYQTTVTVGGTPFANALVSIWDGTNQPFSALTDASGNVTIPHTLTNGTSATLTITGFNLTPYIGNVTIGVTSVNNIDFSSSLQVYPNPSNGNFELNYSFINKENSNVKIVDLLGNTVYADMLMQNAQNKTITLNNVKNGLYFLTFENSNGTVTKKITIEK